MRSLAAPFKKIFVSLLTVFIITLTLLPVSAFAQQSILRISVKDESGNPIAAATVELKLKNTIIKTAITDKQGEAAFANINAGNYEVTATKDEFEALTQSD